MKALLLAGTEVILNRVVKEIYNETNTHLMVSLAIFGATSHTSDMYLPRTCP